MCYKEKYLIQYFFKHNGGFMSEEYTFPPYAEKVQEAIKEFGGTLMEEYRGHDIKPLWTRREKLHWLQISLQSAKA